MRKTDVIKSGSDSRGTFTKLATDGHLADGTPLASFVEELATVSAPGVLRGLHFQHEPAQAKWAQCLSGRVWDVLVDLRKGLPSYGTWSATTLSFDGPLLYIAPGFAHGFCVTSSEPAIMIYRFQKKYSPGGEGSIRWDDPRLKIEWPVDKPILSERDLKSPDFSEYEASPLATASWWEGSLK